MSKQHANHAFEDNDAMESDRAAESAHSASVAPGRRDGIHAHDLRVDHQLPAQPSLNFDAEPGTLLVMRGPAGGGKTALLLTLGGRMKPASGELVVFGNALPRHAARVRAQTGIGPVRNVNDLDSNLSVNEHVAERLIFSHPWYRPWVSKRDVAAFIQRANDVIEELNTNPLVEADRPIQPIRGDDLINDLTPLATAVLQTAFALVGEPKLVLYDDLDSLRERADRRAAWSGLLSILARYPHLILAVTCEDTAELDDVLPGVEPAAMPEIVLVGIDPNGNPPSAPSSSTSLTSEGMR